MSSSAIELGIDLVARRSKSLAVLQKIDPSVLEIVLDCSHVAVYRFIENDKRWDRLDVEGALFITKNSSEPSHSLIILNRRGPVDFILDMSTVLKISLQPPYLMLLCDTQRVVEKSTADCCIFAIWVHDGAELQAIYSIINRMYIQKSSSEAKADRLLSMLRPQTRLPVTTSDDSKPSPIRTYAYHSEEAGLSINHPANNVPAATINTDVNISSSVVTKSTKLLSILKKAPPSQPDATAQGSADHEIIANPQASIHRADYSNSGRRAQLLSLMRLREPAPRITDPDGITCVDSNTHKGNRSSEQGGCDREMFLRQGRPSTEPMDELLTDSQIAIKRNANRSSAVEINGYPAAVTGGKQDKLKLLLGELNTSNDRHKAGNDTDPVVPVVSTFMTSRAVKLISPSDLKATGY